MILSTKHLLTTVSEKIEFNEEFYKFFTLTAGQIEPVLNNDNIPDLDDYAIWINPNEIYKSDELDDDSSFNTYIQGSFYVQNLVTKEHIEIKSLNESKQMFLTDESLTLLKKGKGYIKFKDMEESTPLFELTILNNELTKPLYELMDLINTARKKDEPEMTYSEMAQKFTDLLLEAGIAAMALSGELIINRLIRNNPDVDYSRPDFSKEEEPDYQIYTILKALENNKSLLIGISSQDIKRQLLSDDLITRKTGSSYLNPLFRKNTSTKRLKDIRKILDRRNKEED